MRHAPLSTAARSKTLADAGSRGWKPATAAVYQGMITFLTILVALGMLATLGTLFAGMIGLTRGDGSPQRSNKLMQWRVILQGVTLVLFALLLLLLRH